MVGNVCGENNGIFNSISSILFVILSPQKDGLCLDGKLLAIFAMSMWMCKNLRYLENEFPHLPKTRVSAPFMSQNTFFSHSTHQQYITRLLHTYITIVSLRQ
jgi:hypothetical protein